MPDSAPEELDAGEVLNVLFENAKENPSLQKDIDLAITTALLRKRNMTIQALEAALAAKEETNAPKRRNNSSARNKQTAKAPSTQSGASK